MYLFDTDILSNLVKRRPSSQLIARLEATPAELQFTSTINLGEMVYGAYRNRERAEQLLERMEQAILPNVTVLPFDIAAARTYGEIRADLELRGVAHRRRRYKNSRSCPFPRLDPGYGQSAPLSQSYWPAYRKLAYLAISCFLYNLPSKSSSP